MKDILECIEIENHNKLLKSGEKEPNLHFQNLVKLASLGHFCLFENAWIKEFIQFKETKIKLNGSYSQYQLIQNTIESINKHQKISRKKSVILSLTKKEQAVFVTYFLNEVEKEIKKSGQKLMN